MHPILEAAQTVRTALKGVGDVNPVFMTTTDKATALRELVAAEAQAAELRLRVMADAADVAETTAARDIADWLATTTRTRWADARADHRLAQALDSRHPTLAAALREGRVNLAQARVVARSLEALPDDLDAVTIEEAEAALVEHAQTFGPRSLGRVGRHILHVVAPDIAEAAEAKALAEAEAEAASKTRLSMRRIGDGTTRIWGRLPDVAATRLATYLESFANPRRHPLGADDDRGTTGQTDPLSRLPYPRRLGEAFIAFLEAADPGRMPIHGGAATTLIVTIDHERLTRELATASVLGGIVAGDETTGWQITAAEARRLACTAHIIPAVLGSDSLPLDMGRGWRLFTAAQRRALLLRDRTCRAEGCGQAGPWCEAHHLHPWGKGGRTDLGNGVLLCRFHHHRAHDPAYRLERLANGDVRFTRRR